MQYLFQTRLLLVHHQPCADSVAAWENPSLGCHETCSSCPQYLYPQRCCLFHELYFVFLSCSVLKATPSRLGHTDLLDDPRHGRLWDDHLLPSPRVHGHFGFSTRMSVEGSSLFWPECGSRGHYVGISDPLLYPFHWLMDTVLSRDPKSYWLVVPK